MDDGVFSSLQQFLVVILYLITLTYKIHNSHIHQTNIKFIFIYF